MKMSRLGLGGTELFCAPNAFSSTNHYDMTPCNQLRKRQTASAFQRASRPRLFSNTVSKECIMLNMVYLVCGSTVACSFFITACTACTAAQEASICKSSWLSAFTKLSPMYGLSEKHHKDVYMESTSNCQIPAYNMLESDRQDCRCSPQKVKTINKPPQPCSCNQPSVNRKISVKRKPSLCPSGKAIL